MPLLFVILLRTMAEMRLKLGSTWAMCLVALLVLLFEVKAIVFFQGGASRAFFSISSIGTRICDCDDCNNVVNLPFGFPFGTRGTLTAVSVSSNANVNFVSTDTTHWCCGGSGLLGVGARIAVLSTDLYPVTGINTVCPPAIISSTHDLVFRVTEPGLVAEFL